MEASASRLSLGRPGTRFGCSFAGFKIAGLVTRCGAAGDSPCDFRGNASPVDPPSSGPGAEARGCGRAACGQGGGSQSTNAPGLSSGPWSRALLNPSAPVPTSGQRRKGASVCVCACMSAWARVERARAHKRHSPPDICPCARYICGTLHAAEHSGPESRMLHSLLAALSLLPLNSTHSR